MYDNGYTDMCIFLHTHWGAIVLLNIYNSTMFTL
jgi:hypothetical protein